MMNTEIKREKTVSYTPTEVRNTPYQLMEEEAVDENGQTTHRWCLTVGTNRVSDWANKPENLIRKAKAMDWVTIEMLVKAEIRAALEALNNAAYQPAPMND